MLIHKIGKNFYHDGVNWTVVSIGNKKFEHESPKGIFALVNLDDMDCVVVFIRSKRVKITVNPSIPSLKADGEELITEYGSRGTYALLKYDHIKN